MSVFADYLDLRTAVIETVGRQDIADVCPRLTKQAESAFVRGPDRLRTRDMIASTSITIAGGSGSLPDGFLEVVGLYDAQGKEYICQTLQQQQHPDMESLYAVGGSVLYGPDGDVTLQYYAELPTITDSMTDSNWLLLKYPDVYLYGVSLYGARHVKDIELVSVMQQYLAQALREANSDDAAARYARARARVKGLTP